MSEEVEEDCPEKSSRGEQSNSKKTNMISIGDPNSSVVQNYFVFKTDDINPQKVRTDTKAMLKECTYNNGCISGVDCEGCAVEVIIILVMMT